MTRKPTHLQNRRTSLGRHPILKLGSSAWAVYYDIKTHPGTREEASHARVHLSSRLYKRTLNRLLEEGLVRDRRTIRDVRKLYAVPQNEAGYPRDLVEVEIVVYVNKYGEYSARANLAGQLQSAGEDQPVAVLTKNVQLRVPKPDEPNSTKGIFDRRYTGLRELAKNPQGLIIEHERVPMQLKGGSTK